MRTVPVVLEIAERVRALAAPDAWIVDFTNPVGIVTRALLDAGHRAIGLCNVAIGVQREIARLARHRAGARPRRPRRAQPPDVGPARPRRRARTCCPTSSTSTATRSPPTRGSRCGSLEELGAIPSSYLRYFYAHDAVLAAQRDGVPRAAAVAEIEARLLEIYRDAEVAEKPALLEQRGGAFYSEAATALIASLSAGTGDVQVVDVRNGGVVEGLQARRRRRASRPHRRTPAPTRCRSAPLAPELLGLVQHVAAYERLTAEAAVTRDPVTARKALLTHPLIGQDELSGTLLESLLAEETAVVQEPAR